MTRRLVGLALCGLWIGPGLWAAAGAAPDAARNAAPPVEGGELRLCLRGDPKTFNPMLAADEYSFLMSYLTHGRLMRVNRQTQSVEPDLAESWKVQDGGKRIVVTLRSGVKFSDGRAFTADDVVYTFHTLFDPATKAPMADQFRPGKGQVLVQRVAMNKVSITLSAPIAGVERMLDSVPVVAAPVQGDQREKAGLGPFVVSEHKPGVELVLRRNDNFWKKDAAGRRLPYLNGIRFFIQSNRDMELARFKRGEIDLIDSADAETFRKLTADGTAGLDAGPAFHSEFIWFNQAPSSPLPAHKKAWFESREFRRAISEAIPRADIARLAFYGRAVPASGPFAESNTLWFRKGQKPHAYDLASARKRLEKAGFRFAGGKLSDAKGNPVEFSILTNGDNATRLKIATLIQHDLGKLGIKLSVVALDFRSILDRIGRTLDYEACLLTLLNLGPDPNDQLNVWMSSAPQHMWNPNQKMPATKWEAEIDQMMKAQAEAPDDKRRKAAIDRMQEIVWEEAPVLYVVNPHSLMAASPKVRNVRPAVMLPKLLWSADRIWLEGGR